MLKTVYGKRQDFRITPTISTRDMMGVAPGDFVLYASSEVCVIIELTCGSPVSEANVFPSKEAEDFRKDLIVFGVTIVDAPDQRAVHPEKHGFRGVAFIRSVEPF